MCEALVMQPVYGCQFNVNMFSVNSFKGPNNILNFIQLFVNVGVISFYLY